VFTHHKAILISLIDKTQKQLRYPQGVDNTWHSLNVMMNGVPYLIIATDQDGFNRQIKSDIE
jgi:hypothetical protein